MDGELDGVLSWREQSQRGVSIGFTFLPHVIIPDKRNGVHWSSLVGTTELYYITGGPARHQQVKPKTSVSKSRGSRVESKGRESTLTTADYSRTGEGGEAVPPPSQNKVMQIINV